MITEISETLFEIPLKNVNAHLISTENELILIDTGSAGDEKNIVAALLEIGRTLNDLTHIVVTHCHPDHAGSLAALQAMTNAPTFMHHIDAEMVERGRAKRPLFPAPGLLTDIPHLKSVLLNN